MKNHRVLLLGHIQRWDIWCSKQKLEASHRWCDGLCNRICKETVLPYFQTTISRPMELLWNSMIWSQPIALFSLAIHHRVCRWLHCFDVEDSNCCKCLRPVSGHPNYLDQYRITESQDQAVFDNDHATISWTSKQGIHIITFFFDISGSWVGISAQ